VYNNKRGLFSENHLRNNKIPSVNDVNRR